MSTSDTVGGLNCCLCFFTGTSLDASALLLGFSTIGFSTLGFSTLGGALLGGLLGALLGGLLGALLGGLLGGLLGDCANCIFWRAITPLT